MKYQQPITFVQTLAAADMGRLLLAGDWKSVGTPVNRGLRPYMAAMDGPSLKTWQNMGLQSVFYSGGDGEYHMRDWRQSHERRCKQGVASNRFRPTSVHTPCKAFLPAACKDKSKDSGRCNPPAEEVVTAEAERWAVVATRTSCPPATLASTLTLGAIHDLEVCFLRINASFPLLCACR